MINPVLHALYRFPTRSGLGVRESRFPSPHHHADETTAQLPSGGVVPTSQLNPFNLRDRNDPQINTLLDELEKAFLKYVLSDPLTVDLSNIDFTPLIGITVGAEGERLNLGRLLFLIAGDKTKYPLERANLSGANLSGVDLNKAIFGRAELFEANLNRANLSGANLSGAQLIEANLIEAQLIEAQLIEANLSKAKLIGANLSKAKLIEAQLIETNLSRANLSGAKLCGVDLSRAQLTGANFGGADL